MNATRASQRLNDLPSHLVSELEVRAAAMQASGIDVISLGVGDPDLPTFERVVDRGCSALREHETHRYPTNLGLPEFRNAVAAFYERRFDVQLDPDTQVLPASGAKECIFHLNFAFLNHGDVALVPDPGYPAYSTGPLLAGGVPHSMPLLAAAGFAPDLSAIDSGFISRARVMFLNYPNTPTGAVAPPGFFEEVVEFASRFDVLLIHDNVYSEATYDGYVAPSLLATPGAMDIAVEVFSLSKIYNMTGWRCAAVVGNAEALAVYRRLKANIDSGVPNAIQLAGATALGPELDGQIAEMKLLYERRRDILCDALRSLDITVIPPKGSIYVWAPVPDPYRSSKEFCSQALDQAAVALSPGAAHGAHGEGYFRMSLTAPEARLVEAVHRLSQMWRSAVSV